MSRGQGRDLARDGQIAYRCGKMIDPTGYYTCRYCGKALTLKRYGRAPTRCQRMACIRRYERERKRRYRIKRDAKALAQALS